MSFQYQHIRTKDIPCFRKCKRPSWKWKRFRRCRKPLSSEVPTFILLEWSGGRKDGSSHWEVEGGNTKDEGAPCCLGNCNHFFYEYVTFITRLSGKSYLSRGFWELPGKEQNSPGLCEKPTRGRRILSIDGFSFSICVLLLWVRTLKMKVTSNSWRKTSKKPRNLADVMVPTGAVSHRWFIGAVVLRIGTHPTHGRHWSVWEGS